MDAARTPSIRMALGSKAGTTATRSRCPSRSMSRTTPSFCSARTVTPDARGLLRCGAGLRLDDDHSARGGAAVVGRRVQPAQKLDPEDVRRGHLLEHADVGEADIVYHHANLVVQVNARAAPSLDARGFATTFPQLDARDRETQRVPRSFRAGVGDLLCRDDRAGAGRARLLDLASRTATAGRAGEADPKQPETTQGAQHSAPPDPATSGRPPLSPRSHRAGRTSSDPPACGSPTPRSAGAVPWRVRSIRPSRSPAPASRAGRARRESWSNGRSASPARSRDPS